MSEPITAEWLESVGFDDADGLSLEFRCRDDVWLMVDLSRDVSPLITAVRVFRTGDMSNIRFPNVHTRHDVRNLVRMLGGGWPDESEGQG